MKQELIPKNLEWPRWQWLISKTYTVIGFLLGVCGLFLEANKKWIYFIRIVVIILFILPISISLFAWLCRVIKIIYLRVRCYPQLNKLFLENLIQNTYTYPFKITKASCYPDFFIEFKKRNDIDLIEGDELFVIDKDEESYTNVGTFKVTEIQNGKYYAKGIQNINAVWKGYVKEYGEITFMPTMSAYFCKREGKNE